MLSFTGELEPKRSWVSVAFCWGPVDIIIVLEALSLAFLSLSDNSWDVDSCPALCVFPCARGFGNSLPSRTAAPLTASAASTAVSLVVLPPPSPSLAMGSSCPSKGGVALGTTPDKSFWPVVVSLAVFVRGASLYSTAVDEVHSGSWSFIADPVLSSVGVSVPFESTACLWVGLDEVDRTHSGRCSLSDKPVLSSFGVSSSRWVTEPQFLLGCDIGPRCWLVEECGSCLSVARTFCWWLSP